MTVEDELTATGNYKKSHDYLLKLKSLADKIKFTKGSVDFLNGVEVVYCYQGDSENAFNFFRENLEMLLHSNIKVDIGAAYNNIGLIYRKMGKNGLALSYYTKSLQFGIEANDYPSLANAYISSSHFYWANSTYCSKNN